MQSVSSRIWTRVAVFISYDDNDYTTGTSRVERYRGRRIFLVRNGYFQINLAKLITLFDVFCSFLMNAYVDI